MGTDRDRSLSKKEFEALKRETQILIVTAMEIEKTAVLSKLDPIAEGIIPLYNNYRFGYFGQFLVAHQHTNQANLNAATAITSTLTEFKASTTPNNNFYVLMPGIACGLQRSKEDTTLISISELKKYLTPNSPIKLPSPIKQQLKAALNTDEHKIILPLFLNPESQKPSSKQRIGDILLATDIKQHNYIATKPNLIEDRGEKFKASFGRVSLVLEHAKKWSTSSPDANFQSHRCQVHSGLIISGDELVNNFSKRQTFISRYDDAIGLEMEGAALGASTDHFNKQESTGKAFFIFAKSICDWGVGKSDFWQSKAANASVSLLHHCLQDPHFFGENIEPSDKKKFLNIFSSKPINNPKKKT